MPQQGGSPLNDVLKMRQQGMTNTQIIDNLQHSGFPPDQIFDAMNQADLKASGSAMPGQYSQDMYDQQAPPPDLMQPQDMSPPDMGMPMQQQSYDQGSTEDMVEAIINEKWEEIVKDINKIVKWKHQMEIKITSVEQKVKDLQDSFDKLHAAIIGKISEYDQNILNVGTEVKAMEKVFQKVLPTFTENVNELSRLTTHMKKHKSKDKP